MKLKKILILTTLSTLLLSGCGQISEKYATSTSQTNDYGGVAFDGDITNSSNTKDTYFESEAVNSSSENYDYETDVVDESENTNYNETNNENSSNITQGAKLIRRVFLSIETEDLDKLVNEIKDRTTKNEGYIESSESYDYSNNRNQSIVIRIPYKKVDLFLDGIEDFGLISHTNDSTEDITLQYADVETHIANLETQHKRLLELMEKADDIDTIIRLNERLSEIETSLDSYNREIKNYDNLVSYSTISIDITEREYVSPEEDTSVFSQIKRGLSDNLYGMKSFFINLFIWFVISLPGFIVFGIFVVIFVFIIKKIIKFIKKKSSKKKKES